MPGASRAAGLAAFVGMKAFKSFVGIATIFAAWIILQVFAWQLEEPRDLAFGLLNEYARQAFLFKINEVVILFGFGVDAVAIVAIVGLFAWYAFAPGARKFYALAARFNGWIRLNEHRAWGKWRGDKPLEVDLNALWLTLPQ